jgi:hypothetical protein
MLLFIPPRTRGEVHKQSRSRDAIRTRVIVTASNKATKAFALRTDLRQRMPAVAAGILTICVLSHVLSGA